MFLPFLLIQLIDKSNELGVESQKAPSHPRYILLQWLLSPAHIEPWQKYRAQHWVGCFSENFDLHNDDSVV